MEKKVSCRGGTACECDGSGLGRYKEKQAMLIRGNSFSSSLPMGGGGLGGGESLVKIPEEQLSSWKVLRIAGLFSVFLPIFITYLNSSSFSVMLSGEGHCQCKYLQESLQGGAMEGAGKCG